MTALSLNGFLSWVDQVAALDWPIDLETFSGRAAAASLGWNRDGFPWRFAGVRVGFGRGAGRFRRGRPGWCWRCCCDWWGSMVSNLDSLYRRLSSARQSRNSAE